MRIPYRRRSVSQCLTLCAWTSLWAPAALHAQVQYDGSLGRPDGPDIRMENGRTIYQILSREGRDMGNNVFHSFQKFDLSSLEDASFEGGSPKNILARITSETASSIDGGILSRIPNVNIFLMNPKGIVFGPNAHLDVTGSFFATTADYIKLGNDGRFAATRNAADSVLTVSDPAAFGFLTPNTAALRVQGSTLSAPKTLGLIGGDVIVEGGSTLAAQDVQLIATRSAGEAALRLSDNPAIQPYAEINAENFAAHGVVSVGEPITAAVTPLRATINANRVVIRGGTLAVKNSDVNISATQRGDALKMKASGELSIGDQSVITSINDGDVRGEPVIDIGAGTATINGSTQVYSITSAAGAGGEIRLNIDGSLSITEFAFFSTMSGSTESGGDLIINAGSMNLDSAFLFSMALSDTKTGDIFLQAANSLSITNGSLVQLAPLQSSQERIVVSAQDITIAGIDTALKFLDAGEEGVGGSIDVTARGRLSILEGAQISATAVSRPGASVNVSAQNVLISGSGAEPGTTGIRAETTAAFGTQGANIQMDVGNLLEVLDGGAINSNTTGQGNGGNIFIRARDMVVTGPATPTTLDPFSPYGVIAQSLFLSRILQNGNSGSIRLSLSGRLDVRDGGLIAVDTTSGGQGGNINIAANSMSVGSGGTVTARTLAADNGGRGGDIIIDTRSELDVSAGGQITVATLGSGAGGSISIRSAEVALRGRDALISAVSGSSTTPATGSGGNIFVRANLTQIQDGGEITASTFGAGAGGNVNLVTNTLRISSPTEITGISAQTGALTAGGAGGTVQVDAQTVTLRGRGAAITTQSFGSGNGGRILVSADSIDLQQGSSIQSSASAAGNAGAITITAESNITLTGQSAISVDAAQSNAGDIRLRSGASVLLTDSQITAQAALDGGNIDLRARDLLRLTNSQITAAAGVNGGNIFIDPIFVIFDRSLVSANAVLGRGGNIRIISDFFFASNSAVTATSELGVDGRVEIDALNNDLTGSLVELPSTLIDAESLLQELCSVKVANFSSFISEGRGGLPPLPGETLPSLMIVP